MSADDPQGGQKYWHPYGGSFATVEGPGRDPGSQKWWVSGTATDPGWDQALTLDGLLGTATPPAPVSTFPALTVAG
jgi:hypothetical protein